MTRSSDMDIINITPPFDFPNFTDMTKREATKYFKWFVEDIPVRIKLLQEFYVGSGEDANDLNLSPDSLIKLWDWFMSYIKTSPTPPERIREEYESLPDHFKGKIEISTEELSFETLLIAHYVGIYYGEVFVQNHSELEWGFLSRPKSHLFLNEPIIMGLPDGVGLNPGNNVYVACLRYVDGERNSKHLFEMYNKRINYKEENQL